MTRSEIRKSQSPFFPYVRRPTYVCMYVYVCMCIYTLYLENENPTSPSLYLCHSSFPNPSVALHTSQLILQPFRCFTYVTAHSTTHLSLLLRHLASRPCSDYIHKFSSQVFPYTILILLTRIVLSL